MSPISTPTRDACGVDRFLGWCTYCTADPGRGRSSTTCRTITASTNPRSHPKPWKYSTDSWQMSLAGGPCSASDPVVHIVNPHARVVSLRGKTDLHIVGPVVRHRRPSSCPPSRGLHEQAAACRAIHVSRSHRRRQRLTYRMDTSSDRYRLPLLRQSTTRDESPLDRRTHARSEQLSWPHSSPRA